MCPHVFHSWEDCKQLLLSQKFFESLRFFDRDNIPIAKLRKLESAIVQSTKFESVEHGSMAVVPLCAWLVALVDYHHARAEVKPFEEKLSEAEQTLAEVGKEGGRACSDYY